MLKTHLPYPPTTRTIRLVTCQSSDSIPWGTTVRVVMTLQGWQQRRRRFPTKCCPTPLINYDVGCTSMHACMQQISYICINLYYMHDHSSLFRNNCRDNGTADLKKSAAAAAATKTTTDHPIESLSHPSRMLRIGIIPHPQIYSPWFKKSRDRSEGGRQGKSVQEWYSFGVIKGVRVKYTIACSSCPLGGNMHKFSSFLAFKQPSCKILCCLWKLARLDHGVTGNSVWPGIHWLYVASLVVHIIFVLQSLCLSG